MAKKTKITDRQREKLRDYFQSDFFKNHKREIIKHIAKQKQIKEASARRNIDRMINYYLGTGKQSRSGYDYIPLIAGYNQKIIDALQLTGYTKIGIFPDMLTAKAYNDKLEHILPLVFSENFEIEIMRAPKS